MIPLIQIATLAVVAFYLGRWREGVRRRNAASWDSLIVRLRPDWSARELSDQELPMVSGGTIKISHLPNGEVDVLADT